MIDSLHLASKPTILLVDDTADELMLLEGVLEDDYEIKTAKNGNTALEMIQSGVHPDLILLDVMMPGIDGYEVCRQLKKNSATLSIPIIFLTSKSQTDDETKGLELGAVDYITKPINPLVLISRVKNHINIKLMQDRLRNQNAWFSRIIEFTPDAMMVIDNKGFITLCNSKAADLFVYTASELLLKNVDEILSLESASGTRKDGSKFVAEIKISELPDLNEKSSHSCVLVRDITAQRKAEEHIKKLAFHDALTELPNRRKMLDYLNYEALVAVRDHQQIAICMLDLDKFKAVNDSLGHSAGDELLIQVAKRIADLLDAMDMVARLGGDEFVIVLHNAEKAEEMAENIIARLSEPFELLQGTETVQIGASIGISFYPQHGNTSNTLLDCADIALYRAKERGRGCYCIF